ncbi:hypothetical protein [Fulvivirga sedimenti]|uniref:Uncharacterized protein n=1 Tax=Fulvivirga sedimenti TaxID=2879465 RepID=A0A9X1HVW1_9BACT|nr:hypothetical protein [Fulvivirga sedimenti]MCA6079213.1 hypothetical protein [Fulvivirga sedimenti]
MKTSLKILAITPVYLVILIIGTMIGMALFPNETMSQSSEGGFDIMLLLVAFLNGTILFYYVMKSNTSGWPLILRTALLSFILQYFITQVESLWFIGALQMSRETVYALLTGGIISSILFAIIAVWMGGKKSGVPEYSNIGSAPQLIRIALLTVIVWPSLYFLAGYYIAWQSPDIRLYYSGSTEMLSFWEMMKMNLAEGLYSFQIFRGIVWAAVAWYAFSVIKGTRWQNAILLGLLFSILGHSQLLLQNSIMPETVRMVHLLETVVSTFAWGMILSYSWLDAPIRSFPVKTASA